MPYLVLDAKVRAHYRERARAGAAPVAEICVRENVCDVFAD